MSSTDPSRTRDEIEDHFTIHTSPFWNEARFPKLKGVSTQTCIQCRQKQWKQIAYQNKKGARKKRKIVNMWVCQRENDLSLLTKKKKKQRMESREGSTNLCSECRHTCQVRHLQSFRERVRTHENQPEEMNLFSKIINKAQEKAEIVQEFFNSKLNLHTDPFSLRQNLRKKKDIKEKGKKGRTLLLKRDTRAIHKQILSPSRSTSSCLIVEWNRLRKLSWKCSSTMFLNLKDRVSNQKEKRKKK